MRSPIKYFGGKGRMVAKLLPLVPPHTVYVEPYFGGGWLFFAKPPSAVEVINDLDGEVVNLYRVLQDKALCEELEHRLLHTPYARAEFVRALEMPPDAPPVERAWATVVRFNMGTGGKSRTPGNWGRDFTSTKKTTRAWLSRIRLCGAWHSRLMGAQIDNRDALEVIRYWDGDETFFYLDPPYHPDTRTAGHRNEYRHEASDDHHQALVEVLLGIKGQAMLSGYDHPVYRPLEEAGWEKHTFATSAASATRTRTSGLQGKGAVKARVPRIEVVWRKVYHDRLPLFISSGER